MWGVMMNENVQPDVFGKWCEQKRTCIRDPEWNKDRKLKKKGTKENT